MITTHEPLQYKVNFNFGSGFDSTTDLVTRDQDKGIITVQNGANPAQTIQFNANDAAQMKEFFSKIALPGAQSVHPARFAPCPHHGGDDETIAFALPITDYQRLASEALKHGGDFNGDGVPDSAYISPKDPNIGFVHLEPMGEQ